MDRLCEEPQCAAHAADSELYIVPVEGGVARRLRCNTPLMNSWHSFSPNAAGWCSPRRVARLHQMFLTHIDEDGNSSPAILIDNATAANRAVNIPEFVNIPPDGMAKIDAPAAESYRMIDVPRNSPQKADGSCHRGMEEGPRTGP